MIKDIIKNLKPSSTLLINEVSNKMEKDGKKVFKFGFLNYKKYRFSDKLH